MVLVQETEKETLLQSTPSAPRRQRPLKSAIIVILVGAATLVSTWLARERGSHTSGGLAEFERCSIAGFNRTALEGIEPIKLPEYLERRDRIARALYADGHDAFVAEPGFTFKYLANVTSFEWESWEPEERPFVLIIQPMPSPDNASLIIANTTFLIPAFELQRALDLNIPSATPDIQYITWEEHISPYLVAKDFLGSKTSLVADDEMRAFILDGFTSEGFRLTPLIDSPEVSAVKAIKSPAEIALVRAVNTLTVEGIRAVQRCAYYGVSEIEISQTLDKVLESAGMEPFFDLVMIGENAACPHCSSGSRVLHPGDMVLIDAGAHLHGLSSDVCRTFLLPHDPLRYQRPMSADTKRKFGIWQAVLDAQTASIEKMVDGGPASEVDLAARAVIEKAGYGPAFTHRLGHGIGIKAHESPYLNKGNTKTSLRTGMAMTSEPGIYLPGDFGVRHEDIVLITENGTEILSGTRAKSPWEP
ncbi:Creatinase/aminopeptidase [Pseudohyphozyma bogoriensis]|nr:Creatinase/aminopeptidase [Pseudohyphozyma bogoriensis]